MSAEPPSNETAGRWEGTRTLASAVIAGVAVVTAIAGGVGFVAGHFATRGEINDVKMVQNRIVSCIERYALPLHDLQLKQLKQFAFYVNGKTNVIAKVTDPGGNYSPQFWWLEKVDSDISELRSELAYSRGEVRQLEKQAVRQVRTFATLCDKMKAERAQWHVRD